MYQAEGAKLVYFFAYCSDPQNNTKNICGNYHENMLGFSRQREPYNGQKWAIKYPQMALQIEVNNHIIVCVIVRVIPHISLQSFMKKYGTLLKK